MKPEKCALFDICFGTWIILIGFVLTTWIQSKMFGVVLFIVLLGFIGKALLQIYAFSVVSRLDAVYFIHNKFSEKDLSNHSGMFYSMATYPMAITVCFAVTVFDKTTLNPLVFNGLIAFMIGGFFQFITYLFTNRAWFIDKGSYVKKSILTLGLFNFAFFSFTQLTFYWVFI